MFPPGVVGLLFKVIPPLENSLGLVKPPWLERKLRSLFLLRLSNSTTSFVFEYKLAPPPPPGLRCCYSLATTFLIKSNNWDYLCLTSCCSPRLTCYFLRFSCSILNGLSSTNSICTAWFSSVNYLILALRALSWSAEALWVFLYWLNAIKSSSYCTCLTLNCWLQPASLDLYIAICLWRSAINSAEPLDWSSCQKTLVYQPWKSLTIWTSF